MASFTIVTTPEQDAGILAMLRAANDAIRARNEARPANEPTEPPLTARDYLRQAVATMLDGWAEQASQGTFEQLREAWQDPVKRDAIKVAAGII